MVKKNTFFVFKTKNCPNDDLFISCNDRSGKLLHTICIFAVAISLKRVSHGPWASSLWCEMAYWFPYTICMKCQELFSGKIRKILSFIICWVFSEFQRLTLVLLSPDMSCLANSVDPDQLTYANWSCLVGWLGCTVKPQLTTNKNTTNKNTSNVPLMILCSLDTVFMSIRTSLLLIFHYWFDMTLTVLTEL